jgi:HK97 family phage portal protein
MVRGMNWLQRAAAKAFRLGPAMAGFEASFGTDPERWSPEAYGRYVATSAPVHACVTIRARNLARLRLRVYKRAPNGERVEVTSGRLYDLMRSVNPHWTFRRLLRMTEMSLCLYGQAFWVLEGGSSTPTGRRTPPREIWWADPSKMRVVPDPDKWIAGFEYDDGASGRVAFPVEDVIWFRLDNPVDQYAGLSPLAAARLAVDTAAGAMRSNRQIFDNGLQLAGIVGPADKTQSLTREQAEGLSQMLERRFKGADKAHRMAVLTQPVSFTSLSLTPKDAEFLGLMKWQLREVATVYGVPPELIGDHEHATYSNVEQAAKALWTDTLIPQATMIADELTEQLVRLFPDEADEVEFDLSDIETLQEDRTEIIEQATKLVGIGVPLNRVLQEIAPRFLPPDGTGYAWGDVAWMPATMVPVDGQAAAPPPPPAVTQAVRAVIDATPSPMLVTKAVDFGSPKHVAVWRAFTARTDKGEARMSAALREYFRRQEQAVLARLVAPKSAKTPQDAADNPFDVIEWAARLKTVGQPIITEVVGEGGQATLDDLNVSMSFDLLDPNVVNVIEGRSQRFARSVTETTWNDLRDTLSAGVQAGEGIPALQNRVARTMDEARTWRTEAIARTEVVGASNLGSLEGARQSGVVTTKTWLAALDDRTRDWHVAAHNQRVALDADFVVGGERGPSPHALPSAANVVNCRCTMTFEVD